MTLDEKKAQVYRLVRLGMDRQEAELLSEISLLEQEQLDTDSTYLARCKIQGLIEEKSLLDRLDGIIEDNTLKGTSTEIRWKLERINPNKWGRIGSLDLAPPEPLDRIPDLSDLSDEERGILLEAVGKTLNGDIK